MVCFLLWHLEVQDWACKRYNPLESSPVSLFSEIHICAHSEQISKCPNLAKSWEQEMTSILSLPTSVTPSKQLVFTVQAKNSGPMCVVMSVSHIFDKSTGTHWGISGRNPDPRASRGLNWSILVWFSVWLFYGTGLVVTWGVTAVKQKGVGQGIVWKQEGWMDNNRQIEWRVEVLCIQLPWETGYSHRSTNRWCDVCLQILRPWYCLSLEISFTQKMKMVS